MYLLCIYCCLQHTCGIAIALTIRSFEGISIAFFIQSVDPIRSLDLFAQLIPRWGILRLVRRGVLSPSLFSRFGRCSGDNSVNYLCYHIGGTHIRVRFRKLSFCGKPPLYLRKNCLKWELKRDK